MSYTIERTRGGYKTSRFLVIGLHGVWFSPPGTGGSPSPRLWVHLHVIFFELVQPNGYQLLIGCWSPGLLANRPPSGLYGFRVHLPFLGQDSLDFIFGWKMGDRSGGWFLYIGIQIGSWLFLDKGIHGTLGWSYFPMHPLEIVTGVILLKTRQKDSAWVLWGLAQLHAGGIVAVALEVCVQESLVDGGVNGFPKLITYILRRSRGVKDTASGCRTLEM